MPGGRPRKPRRSKIIQGTFRKDRNPDREPEPRPVLKVPSPPSGMGKYAREFWKQISAELVDQGLLTNMDLISLRLCCETYGVYQEAREAIYYPRDSSKKKKKRRRRRTLAEYLQGQNSQTIVELTAMRAAERAYKSYLTEFGLSPAGRNRIHLPKSKEGGLDPMEALLRAT